MVDERGRLEESTQDGTEAALIPLISHSAAERYLHRQQQPTTVCRSTDSENRVEIKSVTKKKKMKNDIILAFLASL